MSLSGALLAALLASGVQAQDPAPTPPPVDLEDITVEGRSTRQAAQQFVQRVAAAPAGARLGRWNTPICVSVANMKAPYGQMLADRIGDIATELGVSVGAPGCTPNVLVIAADDGPAVASALVEGWRRRFRPPIDNTNMGLAALERFKTSDAPVRWWHISLPVSADTGQLAARVAGEDPPSIGSRTVSRMRSPLRYDLRSATVVIDMAKANGVMLPALLDYAAMVVLAQVDPRSDYSDQPTILNLFNAPEGITGMTDWDLAYLHALYEAEPDRASARAQEAAVSDRLEARRRRSAGEPEESQPR
ncbi:hypothetical protein [Brevundimonas sp.]|jgi:hypothetical protein|uniref:hypothetical protein n=1 Tax=Brevundimonas sp. TaxID=1871086 RepID=UPI0028AE39A5|nr:hypothetical protein [Brevundimonas sp.]